jgi:transposase
MPSISVTTLFNFSRMKVTFSEVAESRTFNFAGVVLMPDLRYSPVCSSCGQRSSSVHTTRSRIVRDLPLGSFRKPKINFVYRLLKCSNCKGIYTESNSVASVGGPRVTHRLASYVKDLCKIMTIQEVTDHLELDWKTVKNIDKEALQQEHLRTDYTGLRILAVDEIAYAKYHRYLTVVIDYETGRVVWTSEGRSKETLLEFFNQMPEETRANIEAVAMDMWEPFTLAVREGCPNAAIVYDFFHIVAKYNEVITQIRRQEYYKASKDDARVIKGSRWILLKNPENLTEKDRPRLNELLATNESLAKVYILKDELKAIWSHTDPTAMELALGNWCELALEAKLTPLTKLLV